MSTNSMETPIPHLSYANLMCPYTLYGNIYPDMQRGYYWSGDFSPEYYIAQAKAGFIAVAYSYEDQEILLPNLHTAYAVLDFSRLHISRKVRSLLQREELTLNITANFDDICDGIAGLHEECWLSPRYREVLLSTQGRDCNFEVLSIGLQRGDELIAGEIGYRIGRTYTSLTGFSRREREFRNCGTAQLVLLARYLEEHNFSFWNLGDPSLAYKIDLGAQLVERPLFLKRWLSYAVDTR